MRQPALPLAFLFVPISIVLLIGHLSFRPAAAEDEPAQGKGQPAAVATTDISPERCKTCHAKEHAAWSESSHAHTFEAVTTDNVPFDIVDGRRVEHAPGWSRFHPTQAGGWEVETVGPDGKPARYPLTHVVGRMRVRMFVTTLPDGRRQVLPGMFEVPVERWFDYTKLIFGQGGTDWDKAPVVNPGDPSFWTGPVRAWDAKCSRCHVSDFQLEPIDPEQRGARATWRALGVDCAACHEGSAAHVQYHETAEGQRVGKDPLLSFESLDRDQQVSFCLRCHMEADIEDPSLPAHADIFERVTPTLHLDPERVDAFGRPLELIYDGLAFSGSHCAAMGKMTCVTCHDPHGTGEPSQLKASPEGSALCASCHEDIAADVEAHTHHPLGSSGSNCVSCHMPFLSIERGHGVVADHSISTPRFGYESDRLAQNACVWCHQEGLAAPTGVRRVDTASLEAAYKEWWPEPKAPQPWMTAIARTRQGARDEASLDALLGALHKDATPRVARASIARLLEPYAAQVPIRLLALARDPDSLVRRSAMTSLRSLTGAAVDAALMEGLKDDSKAVRSAAARASLAGWSRARANRPLLEALIPVLREHVEADAGQEGRWFDLAAALDLAGDRAGALWAWRRYVALDPFSPRIEERIRQLEKALGK